jgi:hypothetical protein
MVDEDGYLRCALLTDSASTLRRAESAPCLSPHMTMTAANIPKPHRPSPFEIGKVYSPHLDQ